MLAHVPVSVLELPESERGLTREGLTEAREHVEEFWQEVMGRTDSAVSRQDQAMPAWAYGKLAGHHDGSTKVWGGRRLQVGI